MRILNKKQYGICASLISFLAVIVAAALWAEQPIAGEDLRTGSVKIEFSHDSGLYSDSIVVYLTAPDADEIRYTLDGSLPDAGSGKTFLYHPEEGIALECFPQEKVYTVRAAAYMGNHQRTSVFANTYILGDNVEERYQTAVLSVTGDPEELFGSETGILTKENRMLRGREYEREVQINLFDGTGREVLNQNGGFRIYGSGSRNKNQPSFRLYARSEYDEQDEFHYIFFENLYNEENALLSKFKRIIVRNSGDDNGFAYLRNELAARLSLEAGFLDVQNASPVCVYINGEYFGVYWFVPNFDDRYFREKYGIYDGQMVVLEGVVSLINEQEGEDEITKGIREEYNALHEAAAYGDLNADSNWEMLNAAVDVENFLQYVAIQNYFANSDCFVNNFKTYRYYSPTGKYQEGTVFDGRYRFLLYDLDETLNFVAGESALAGANIMTNSDRMGYDIFYNALFANIMSRPEGREYYIRYYLSLVNYYFEAQHAISVMEEMHESHAKELRYLYNETELLKGNAETPEDADYNHALNEIDRIKDFLTERPENSLADLSNAFQLDRPYEIHMVNEKEANIAVDYAVFHEREYRGTYYAEIPVEISVTPQCGYRFVHWLVDGNIIEEDRFWLTEDMIEGKTVEIECVTVPDENAELYITAVKSRGGNDYLELSNLGQRTVNLINYFLSDGSGPWNGSSLPALEIQPGESVIVYCKNYTGVEALGKPGVGFNIKAGESVNLYRSNGILLQSVTVPKLGSKEGVYTLDRYSGTFRELIPGE
ncbi:MAG: CotH kinase family protein [Bacteroidales bacterium]|nr:CotH kinase family protein [Lachnoclostridium sp.]MCM1383869.1 CotH kinase family protein [Lachnoclostridium sp.]MCM1464478.1 CotH kinase family protein [Bacteroidales bacterium]